MGRETITLLPAGSLLNRLLLAVFVWQRRNEVEAAAHLGIPANRVVELGRLDGAAAPRGALRRGPTWTTFTHCWP